MIQENDPYFNWIPNEIQLEIIKFVISLPDKWKLNWRTISLVSKRWNKNSWTVFYASIPIQERTEIFIYACPHAHLYYVQQILLHDNRVDPSAGDNWLIRCASDNGHTEVVKLLLQDKRVDPSNDDNYAIRWASANGHIEVVKLLLQDKRVDPSAHNNHAIRWASDCRHTEVVKLLLQDGRCVFPTPNNE